MSAEFSTRLPHHRWLIALALLPLAVAVIRWASFLPSVIDWDETLYILQAREWLRGNWPFSGVWDMHPPGAPAVIAGAFLLLGESLFTVRLLGVFCVAATGYALIALTRVVGAPRRLGYAAAIFYAAHTVLMGGLASNTEIIFAPLVVSSMALALARGPVWPRLVGMGLLVGCALLIKQVVTPEGCLAYAIFAWPLLRQRRWGLLLATAAVYALLCLMPTLLVAGLYWLRGEFDIWFESTVLAPLQYASGRIPLEQMFWRITLSAIALRWLLVLSLGALFLPWRDPALRRLTLFALAWLGAASLAVAVPGFFFPHYFLILLPPLALLAAIGIYAFAERIAGARGRWLLAAVAGFVAIDLVSIDVAPRLSRGFAVGAPDTPRRMAALMNDELQPGDTIFVPNYQPVVYFLTNARLPTRFPFPVHLTGGFANLAGVDTDAEVARILASRPRFIVLDRTEWFAMRPSAMSMLTEALEEGYELAASFAEVRGSVELWRRVEAE
ncbi:glycosyltransferase family 39 protein [Sediminicoccus sp. KRV36]|uniref:ArnT family glycosyltransferase n=1 Tax=Sediminicoccus sp. KRV36 TaxID=3133721 RepID=UPI00200C2057|nr:glycosyltransferase family 39 protein [Sediminicoccus rosea]UPY35477.1 glycosyltransferase family 39 protein [Sediminicoccus rosea]